MPSFKRVEVHTLSTDFRKATRIVEEKEVPTPKAGNVVVKNHYAGINPADINFTNGVYGLSLPSGCGFEAGASAVDHLMFLCRVLTCLYNVAVGKVYSMASDVDGFKVGDVVFYQRKSLCSVDMTLFLPNRGWSSYSIDDGAFAEYLEVPSDKLFKHDVVDLAVLPLLISGVSGAIALDTVGEMKTNETVLVTAAAGTTGQIVVQLAKLAGNHVIGTCGSEEKGELLKSLGCDRVVNYHTEDLGEVLKKEYPKGVDLVFETVGGKMFSDAAANIAVHGRIVIFGFISGYQSGEPVHSFSMMDLHLKSASIRGFLMGNHRERSAPTIRKLQKLIQTKKLKVEVDPTVFQGLESIPDAIDYMFACKNKGKLAIKLV